MGEAEDGLPVVLPALAFKLVEDMRVLCQCCWQEPSWSHRCTAVIPAHGRLRQNHPQESSLDCIARSYLKAPKNKKR